MSVEQKTESSAQATNSLKTEADVLCISGPTAPEIFDSASQGAARNLYYESTQGTQSKEVL